MTVQVIYSIPPDVHKLRQTLLGPPVDIAHKDEVCRQLNAIMRLRRVQQEKSREVRISEPAERQHVVAEHVASHGAQQFPQCRHRLRLYRSHYGYLRLPAPPLHSVSWLRTGA